MSKLSQHFSANEFVCRGKDGCSPIRPPERLLRVLEALRSDRGGRPLRIVSGYRCEKHNDRVGGAFASRHLRGDAVDIPSGYATVAQAARAGAVGIGSQNGWAIHLDVRPGRAARWTYPKGIALAESSCIEQS